VQEEEDQPMSDSTLKLVFLFVLTTMVLTNIVNTLRTNRIEDALRRIEAAIQQDVAHK
jgi:preprotein translocase subunit SecG